MARSIGRLGAGVALAWALAALPATAQTFCDPDKPIVEDQPDGYRDRSDRCEGVYVRQQVSGGFLEIASFSLGDVDYSLGGGALTLAWPARVSDQPVQIRAVSLRKNLHYQMDTRRPTGTTSFEWPTDLLLQLKLQPDELGVRAWTDLAWGHRARELHLPLGIHQGAPEGGASLYQLVVMPELALGGLKGGLERLEGDDFASVFQDSDLGGFYPAKKAISVEIPIPDQPGIYRLRLIATPDRGGPAASTFVWFQHPGP
jgi:hypothetical protein